MVNSNLTSLSRFLSLILRHRAADFGLVLDEEGYADLDAVRLQIERRFKGGFSRADLTTLLTETPGGKQRFEVQGNRIRAMYGHSAVSEISYPPVIPPDILYHGTTPDALPAIRKQGLKSQKRQYVHLSTAIERASNVATRHGKPVILRVRAYTAHNAGCIFHHPEPQHYLVKAVPPQFIEFED